ncbi:MAG: MaoC family dehydratase [Acidilobus sp.]
MDQRTRYIVGLSYKELSVGQKIVGHAITVTESHIAAFAGLSGDFNPLHVDDEYAKGTIFKGRIAHGVLTLSFISALLGMAFSGTLVALTEIEAKFLRPVRPGDTIRPVAEVISLTDVPKYNGGRVRLRITVVNQRGERVVEGETELIVAS